MGKSRSHTHTRAIPPHPLRENSPPSTLKTFLSLRGKRAFLENDTRRCKRSSVDVDCGDGDHGDYDRVSFISLVKPLTPRLNYQVLVGSKIPGKSWINLIPSARATHSLITADLAVKSKEELKAGIKDAAE